MSCRCGDKQQNRDGNAIFRTVDAADFKGRDIPVDKIKRILKEGVDRFMGAEYIRPTPTAGLTVFACACFFKIQGQFRFDR